MAKKITLKDIARAAGVSEMTVSRALRGSTEISESTRTLIQELARELGYVPNRIAGALSSQTVNLVGIVVPSLSSMVFPEVLRGISDAFSGSPLQPVIGVAGYNAEDEERVIREMLSWRPSGLIVAGLEHSDTATVLMKDADVPVVEIMDTDGAYVDYCVGISHHEAGRQMAQAILQAGHRKIGFIGTKMPHDFRAQKRLNGFLEVLAENDLQIVDQELYALGSSLAKGRELAAELLQREPDLDCIYFSSDIMAAGALMHCLANGVSVPGDIALAGHNNLDILDGLPLRLATTDSYRFEIGHAAGTIILNCIAGQAPVDKLVSFPATVLPGASLI